MKLVTWSLVLVALALVACDEDVPTAGSPAAEVDDEDGDDDGLEEAVALDAVPATALAAAKKAVPGVVFTSAEREVEGGVTLYSLEGSVDGERCEVEVTPDGEVLEVERGADDDED